MEVTSEQMTGNRRGTMNHNRKHGIRGLLVRIGRPVAAAVIECNCAQTRVSSLRNTPSMYLPREN